MSLALQGWTQRRRRANAKERTKARRANERLNHLRTEKGRTSLKELATKLGLIARMDRK